MNTTFSKMFASFQSEIKTCKEQQRDILKSAKGCMDLCSAAMISLREFVLKNSFINDEEEIIFFKETKPLFCSELIYWSAIYNAELHMPEGLIETKEKYIRNQLMATEINFSNNLAFCLYYKSGEIFLDAIYFLRKNNSDSLKSEKDENFSTTHDFTVAKIIADKRLQLYFYKSLSELNNNSEKPKQVSEISQTSLKWTAAKAGLVELIYAMQSAAVYNNGNAGVKEIAESFEKLFHVDLGNYYNVFNEIRLRKKSRAQLLDHLKERLIEKMDSLDEKL
jgi:hypothetical protein